jgi:hypothetical protein
MRKRKLSVQPRSGAMRCGETASRAKQGSARLVAIDSVGSFACALSMRLHVCGCAGFQYKKHVKELMSKGASRLTGGKRVRLISDEGEEADKYELHVLTEYIDGDPNYALVFFGQTRPPSPPHSLAVRTAPPRRWERSGAEGKGSSAARSDRAACARARMSGGGLAGWCFSRAGRSSPA